MTSLWMMSPAFDIAEQVMQLEFRAKPPRLSVINFDTLAEFFQDAVAPRIETAASTGSARLNDLPPPAILKITEPGFAPDYFNNNFEFVSARAREAMALSDDEVQWLPVDSSQSLEAVQNQDYRMLHVLRSADPFDRNASDGEMSDYMRADGSIGKQWQLRHAGPNGPWPKVVWRSDFAPPAPLFRSAQLGLMLATEAFAARVRGADIRDIVFLDMTNDGTRTETHIFRTDNP